MNIPTSTEQERYEFAAMKMLTTWRELSRANPGKPRPDLGWMETLLRVGMEHLGPTRNTIIVDAVLHNKLLELYAELGSPGPAMGSHVLELWRSVYDYLNGDIHAKPATPTTHEQCKAKYEILMRDYMQANADLSDLDLEHARTWARGLSGYKG